MTPSAHLRHRAHATQPLRRAPPARQPSERVRRDATRVTAAPTGSQVLGGDPSPTSESARTNLLSLCLTAARKPAPGLGFGPMGRRVLEWARCPIRSQFAWSENKKIPPECGIADGETRTRTGDTTIFSRAAVSSETGPFAGNYLASGHVYGVRVFPDFAPVSLALRQMAGVVCLFVGGHGDPPWRAGRRRTSVGPGARLRGRRSRSVIADRGHEHDKYRRELWRRGVNR